MSVGIFSRDANEGDLLKRWRELGELPPPVTQEENEKRTAEIHELLKEIERLQLPGRPLLDRAVERETVVRKEKLVVFKEAVRASGFSVPDWWVN